MCVGGSNSPVWLLLIELLPPVCQSAAPFYKRYHLGLEAECKAHYRHGCSLHREPADKIILFVLMSVTFLHVIHLV